MRCARLAAPFVTALCIFDTLRGGYAARRSRPLIRRALFRRSSTIRVAMLRRWRRPCWRAGVPAPCLACVFLRPSKTALALDSLRSLLTSLPCLVALASWFHAVRIPPLCRNRLHAIVSNLFYRTYHSQHSTCRRIRIARCPTAQGRMSHSPRSRINIAIRLAIWGRRCGECPFAFSPQRISRSESGFIANVGYYDENNIPDARREGAAMVSHIHPSPARHVR